MTSGRWVFGAFKDIKHNTIMEPKLEVRSGEFIELPPPPTRVKEEKKGRIYKLT